MSFNVWDVKEASFSLLSDGTFTIENYHFSKPFASFFPGIAGPLGIPLWAFYVNRGQCVVSLGHRDKDGAILEFYPANKAYQMVSLQGYRTFFKLKKDSGHIFYEPFQNSLHNRSFNISNRMFIRPWELEIEEINRTLGVAFNVIYFPIVNEPFSAIARLVLIKNLNPKEPIDYEVIDGVPVIMPYGMNQYVIKNMTRTAEAWMQVNGLPNYGFYNVKVELDDRPEVVLVKEGHFFVGCAIEEGQCSSLPVIADSAAIFNSVPDFSYPEEFMLDRTFILPDTQRANGKLPSGFVFDSGAIKPVGEKHIASLLGHISSERGLKKHLERLSFHWLMEKRAENVKIVSSMMKDVCTVSAFQDFDQYVQQTYLDNLLRGGYPIVYKSDGSKDKKVFYLYGRKHGDLERDYNNFVLEPTFYSQGNGNYRDVNQNRRLDVVFHPEVYDSNIKTFVNLIQLDGFNPLVIKGVRFVLKADRKTLVERLSSYVSQKQAEAFADALIDFGEFAPGDVKKIADSQKIKIRKGFDELLGGLLGLCETIEDAAHGEGFWTDHWSYNIDLIESFKAVYPDDLRRLFWQDFSYTFFDNDHYVAKRAEKYVVTENGVRQYKSVRFSKEKSAVISSRPKMKNKVRVQKGKGDVYYTNLYTKLFVLFLNKVASLDPYGIGIEMEADKPNWYDSLNGLPGLIGSSSCETMECLRLARLLNEALALADNGLALPVEVYGFYKAINGLLEKDPSPFEYWQKAGAAKEAYRDEVFWGVDGAQESLASAEVGDFIARCERLLSDAVERAKRPKDGLIDTYFYYSAKDYKVENGAVVIKEFEKHTLPLFLEGQVHYLRAFADKAGSLGLYNNLKKTDLYDRELSMYKVCANLKSASYEIGRSAIFPRGWLENESIWLHMEYKYLLELIRRGLYKEFYQDLMKCIVCFQKPSVYGRNITENVSFIVSSAHEDPTLHGNGFVARLSGSTIEFLHMWLIMCAGKELFTVNEKGELCFTLNPSLPEWFFTPEIRRKILSLEVGKDSFAFRLFSNTIVVYNNPEHLDCYDEGVGIVEMVAFAQGKRHTVKGNCLTGEWARLLREGKVDRIVARIGRRG